MRCFINSLLGLVYFIFLVNHAITIFEERKTFFLNFEDMGDMIKKLFFF